METAKKETRSRGAEGLRLGPGVLVAAAFVGPGTVITALSAGARFGGALWWVVLLSLLLAYLLQEMAARIGTLTGQGLGETLRRMVRGRAAWVALAVLVTCAIGFGNAAYQMGHLIGAALGLGMLASGIGVPGGAGVWGVILLAVLAAALVWSGSYRLIERVLMGMVAVMGLAFVLAAGIAVIDGHFTWATALPRWPADGGLTVLALLGTTIVPSSLFLHASGASQRWAKIRPRDAGLRTARRDAAIGIAAGGLITVAILVLAASLLDERVSAESLPTALVSAVGSGGAGSAMRWLLAVGLFAAGLTSAVTAPLAAAYAVCGIWGWSKDERSGRFRLVWAIVLGCGLVGALWWGRGPAETILLAEAANALVLPVIGGGLLLACNAKIFGKHANGPVANTAAGIALLVVLVLAVAQLVRLAA